MTLLGYCITIKKVDTETLDLNQKFVKEHEEKSQTHVTEFQKRLDALVTQHHDSVTQPPDSSDQLKGHVDIQLKIEELILKGRIAEHTKWQVYGPGLIALATGLLGLIIGYIPDQSSPLPRCGNPSISARPTLPAHGL